MAQCRGRAARPPTPRQMVRHPETPFCLDVWAIECQHSRSGAPGCLRRLIRVTAPPAGWPALPRRKSVYKPGFRFRSRTVLVSRRYRQSPVFYEPTPARWPWALALLLTIGAVVFAAVVRPGMVPLSGLNGLLPA